MTAFLPIGADTDLTAAIAISEWLRDLRKKLPQLAVTGGTISSLARPAFHGFYFSDKFNKWIEEAVSMFILDVPYEGETLDSFIRLLEMEFSNFYEEYSSAQEEIGVAAFVLQYASYDPSLPNRRSS